MVDESRLAVVIPGGHAPETGVGLQQRKGGSEIFIKVRRYLQIILDYHNLKSDWSKTFLGLRSMLKPDQNPSP